MTFEGLGPGDIEALATALSAQPGTTIVAPNSTVNTGLMTGGQRHTVSGAPGGYPGTTPPRQGPVRPETLKALRRRFVPPPGFEAALTALDSGICVLIGEPGTGRETHALGLLAHGRPDPVLIQVDGATDLTRWGPMPPGVHGYLMMEPPDPFTLRAWDLSRLEALLEAAQARLLIVLEDAPGLATALADRLGAPVLKHLPPDPRQVFATHFTEACPGEEAGAELLRSLGPGLVDELLPDDLPPRFAAQAAEAVARSATADGTSRSGVLDLLVRAETPGLVARALEDPVVFAHLSSLSVFGGLERGVVVDRAADLSGLMSGGAESAAVRQRTLPGTLRLLGARCTPRAETDAVDTAAFFWPAVGEAAWKVLCREHPDLLALVHLWLAETEGVSDQVDRAGRALAALAAATGGRSLDLLRELALDPRPASVEVAARCLAACLHEAPAAAGAEELLEEWSSAPEPALRRAVAYACRSERDGLMAEPSLRLLHKVMQALGDDGEDVGVALALAEALVHHFAEGAPATRQAVLHAMCDWALADGVPGQLVALVFPALAGTDLAWCGSQILAGSERASAVVELTAHALNESISYPAMRDVLLLWCHEAHSAARPDEALEGLVTGLVDSRQPGFLRWLLAAERSRDGMPGRELAGRLLDVWRSKAPTSHTD
ncbi:hypothetical protein [Streptomyces sp. NPDC089915]|uniref:hypothetical protein n=1 Tax=Streptomyces sp. NPDC089915 TaxID=3155186 RepID=UPI003421D8C6